MLVISVSGRVRDRVRVRISLLSALEGPSVRNVWVRKGYGTNVWKPSLRICQKYARIFTYRITSVYALSDWGVPSLETRLISLTGRAECTDDYAICPLRELRVYFIHV